MELRDFFVKLCGIIITQSFTKYPQKTQSNSDMELELIEKTLCRLTVSILALQKRNNHLSL